MNLEMSNLPVKCTYKFGKLEKCVKKLFICNFYSIENQAYVPKFLSAQNLLMQYVDIT